MLGRAVIRNTIDWRIIVGEGDWTTGDHLSAMQARTLIESAELAFGEYHWVVRDLDTAEERSAALVAFIQPHEVGSYLLIPRLADFITEVSEQI